MDIKKFIQQSRRDFDISVSLIGVIPLLVFMYLIVAKIASFKVLVGQIGYIIICIIMVFLIGVVVGKRMFGAFVNEIMDKSKRAAITETALGVGDQINNPLMAIRGNLEIIEMYALENKLPPKVIDRIRTIKDNFERVRQITENLSNLSKEKVETTKFHGDFKMLDLNKS
jgi:signal transduction histidine kinase